ncbi:MAG: acetate--CoA ligase family protein [Bacteroidales bacterium]|nr:acetate--CoA ligase family protein [Bacteroidales bacterium]
MITEQLINPRSIVVVGGSNDIFKPGGKVLKNLIDGNFKGELYVTNPKEDLVQGIKCFRSPAELPYIDLAIIAIAARFIPATVELLAQFKNTKAFIILSAGFSEMKDFEEGKILENEIVDSINSVNASLVGPNCIGVLTPNYQGVFTLPIPKLDPQGCDFISGSGATACFIMEAGIPNGLTFSRVFSVGNSAQLGVEEILKYMDETFDPEKDSKVKLLYIENIDKPQILLKHAVSLINKGCKIAAIKAGGSEAGSRAASSHTGAIATSDFAVNTLFRKAGIVRCNGREELIYIASIFMHKELIGKNIAIISHAGGPSVMLTDSLSNQGLSVPHIDNPASKELLTQLFPGSSVANPIDFLATGTAEQLGTIIDYVDNKFDEIDAMVVIFGTSGLFTVSDVYAVLDEKMKHCKKPIFPVLPSILTAKKEVQEFLSKGRINFPDEVFLGNSLSKVFNTNAPAELNPRLPKVDTAKIRSIIENTKTGYISPVEIQNLLDAAGIQRVAESVAENKSDAVEKAESIGFPVVMKVVGPLHKSDKGGVFLNIKNKKSVESTFDKLMSIENASGVLIQQMLSGTELFLGVKYEEKFGHMILCGLGGIFIEIIKDVSASFSPVSEKEASDMIKRLKAYKIFKGTRGQQPINENKFIEAITRLSALVEAAPEIIEIDLNPLLGTSENIVAVDARINVLKTN